MILICTPRQLTVGMKSNLKKQQVNHLVINSKNLAQVAMVQKLMDKRRSKLSKKVCPSKPFLISNHIAIIEPCCETEKIHPNLNQYAQIIL